MLTVYRQDGDRLAASVLVLTQHSPGSDAAGAVWLDLLNPTRQEDQFVEQLLGISVPTQEEAQDLEVSARLYHEDGAEFMTMTGAAQLESDEPMTAPITFILKNDVLVTVRYTEPKPFWIFGTRAQKPGSVPCASGEQIMLGLVEAIIERVAESMDQVGRGLDKLSREVFRHKTGNGKSRSRDFQTIIEQLGIRGDLLAVLRESLVSLSRLLAYHTTKASPVEGLTKDAPKWVNDMRQDVAALSDHASYLSDKTSFLLDATLGLINLEQNQIIKLFSIAAVVLLPPTLVATVYGMNFKAMPELEWALGYPMALALMVVTAVIPFVWFRKKGWL